MITGGVSRHEALFPDPIESVWQALTDSAELAAWLMPNDFAPVLGHRFTMDCDPVGVIEGRVLEIDPPNRMVWSWTGEFGETIVTFELSQSDGGTRLQIEHRGWTDSNREDGERFDTGWPGKLSGLAELLASQEKSALWNVNTGRKV